MGKNNLNTIDKIYILPAETPVFSISLQQNIKFINDVYVKITNCVYSDDDNVFAMLQLRFENIQLSYIAGKDMSSYTDKIHGDIATKLSDLKST